MRSLVTGGTGLVGNNLVRLLLERGDQVRVLIRATSDPRPLADLEVEAVQGDVCDPAAVERACQGVDRVFHAAALVHLGWSGLHKQMQINVGGTRHVAEAARRAGIRMVHVSTTDTVGIGIGEGPWTEECAPGGNPECPYVVTKVAAEEALLKLVVEGLDAVIVNPSYMLGPWDWKPSSGRMLLEVASGKALVAPPGGGTFCDVRDVALGAIAAAETGRAGQRYILGGYYMTYLQAWRLFADLTGGRRPLMTAGPLMRALGGMGGDLWYRLTGREPDVNSATIRLACLKKNFSSRRAVEELGYRNRPIEETVLDAWHWFLEHGYVRPRRARAATRQAGTRATTPAEPQANQPMQAGGSG